jgi:hypothetical protein
MIRRPRSRQRTGTYRTNEPPEMDNDGVERATSHGTSVAGASTYSEHVSFSAGGMRERTNRTVSKTVVSQGTVGSNPTPSAKTLLSFQPRP